MGLTNTGEFSFTIQAEELARGLRPSKDAARNLKYLTECYGAVGINKVLQSIALFNQSDILVGGVPLVTSYPYPQLFDFSCATIICTENKIYELVSSTAVLKLTVTTGDVWNAVDFYSFVYMSNGVVAVVRDSTSFVYSVSTLPTAQCMCNFNGQVVIGTSESV